MKAAYGWALLLLMAGCAGRQKPEETATKSHLLELEAKFTNLNEKNFLHYKHLTELVQQLESRLATLENRDKARKEEIDFLRERLNRPPTAVVPNPEPGPPAVEPDINVEQALREIDEKLRSLKGGADPEEIAKAFKVVPAISRLASRKACEALKESLRDVEYMRKLEVLLAKFPAADLKEPLEEALRDGVRRYPAARVVGDVGDRELSKALEAYTSDPGLDFCYWVGFSLVRCKNRAGVPALLRVLRSDDKNTRLLAINALRGLNADNALGYDFSKSPDANKDAIAAWEQWFEQNGAKLFE